MKNFHQSTYFKLFVILSFLLCIETEMQDKHESQNVYRKFTTIVRIDNLKKNNLKNSVSTNDYRLHTKLHTHVLEPPTISMRPTESSHMTWQPNNQMFAVTNYSTFDKKNRSNLTYIFEDGNSLTPFCPILQCEILANTQKNTSLQIWNCMTKRLVKQN